MLFWGLLLTATVLVFYKPKSENPSALQIELASAAKGRVKRSNIKSVVAGFEPEIVSRNGGYNIYTDRYTSR